MQPPTHHRNPATAAAGQPAQPDIPIPAPYNWRHFHCPAPVTVDIVTEPPDPWCVASIVLSADPQFFSTPCYSIQVAGQDALIVSHAQLCALVLAAGQIVNPCTQRGAAQ